MDQDIQSVILFPPLSFLREAAFVTMFHRVVETNILVTYPITLYTRDDNGTMDWLGFLYTFLCTGKDGAKTSFITYPLCFSEEHKREIYERLLKEAGELARAFGASRMEYEGYQSITGEVVYPLSGMTFGNTCNTDFIQAAEDNQFTVKKVDFCYEVTPLAASESLRIYTIPDFLERRRAYLELCSMCDSFPQYIDVEKIVGQPPGITDRMYFKKDWIIFTESGEEKGAIRWIPQSIGKEKKAKIVRMLFYNAGTDFVCNSVRGAINQIGMSADRIQVADIPGGTPLEDMVKNLGGVKVYETLHMVKEISRT
jgi:hypothetical protein